MSLGACNLEIMADISREVFISPLLNMLLNGILMVSVSKKGYVGFNDIVAICFFQHILLAKNARVKKTNQTKRKHSSTKIHS